MSRPHGSRDWQRSDRDAFPPRYRRLDGAAIASQSSMRLRIVAGVIFAVISAGLAAIIVFPPKVIVTLAPAAVMHLPPSGLRNPVAGVLFVYRAFDTLLEKVVLLLALLGVWSLTPDRFWGGVPGPHGVSRPNGILAFLAQLLPPFGILVGIYMFWTAPIIRVAPFRVVLFWPRCGSLS